MVSEQTGSARIGGLSVSEVEDIVVKLAKDGIPTSRIGLILRDQHAVPSIKGATGKSVKQILEAHGIRAELPEDLKRVIIHAVKLHDHLGRNPRDLKVRRSLETVEARINRLASYYRREGILPADWRYDRERAALLARG